MCTNHIVVAFVIKFTLVSILTSKHKEFRVWSVGMPTYVVVSYCNYP